MSEKATEWFGMRVTPTQKEKIRRLAERRGTTQKDAVLEAVERQLNGGDRNDDRGGDADGQTFVDPQPGSVLALTEDLYGQLTIRTCPPTSLQTRNTWRIMARTDPLIDAGPLMAYFCRRDNHHEWAAQQMAHLSAPVYNCEAVLSEAFHLLEKVPKGGRSS